MAKLTQSEYGKIGGRRSADSFTPEQRRDRARAAHLAGAVRAVCDRAPDLRPDQVDKIRAIFGSASEATP